MREVIATFDAEVIMLSLSQIHELEVNERYPGAIKALEERLEAFPDETETVIRLGFNLWYAVVEADRMAQLPVEEYSKCFVQLLRHYMPSLSDNADFCWAYGLGIELFWYHFPGGSEKEGIALTRRAGELDKFWKFFQDSTITQEQIAQHLAGRGILGEYYAVEQCTPVDVQKAARH